MAFFKVNNIRIAGISATVPKKIVSNLEYEWLSEDERKKVVNIIGVQEKRTCDEGVTTSDMAIKAAKNLIDGLGWKPEEIEVLIYVAQLRDYILPNTAHYVHGQLGLPKTCAAFDVPLGCSGYVYGLFNAANTMVAGNIKKALLIAGESSASVISERDKVAFPIFGDAATVTALEFSEGAPTMYFNLQTDGSGVKKLYVPGGGIRLPLNEENSKEEKIAEGIYRSAKHLIMEGVPVFEFAIREVPDNINALLKYAGKTVDDADWFITHQANLLMTQTIGKLMKISSDKIPYSLKHFGNTSSASIPLTIVTQIGKQVATKSNWLLSGFGTGLSWGTCFIENGPVFCPELTEY